jgi:hypothetical protein
MLIVEERDQNCSCRERCRRRRKKEEKKWTLEPRGKEKGKG